MAGAVDATEQLLFDALSAMTGTTVFQHAPNDTPPPVTIIGDLEGFPIGPPGDPDRRVPVTIVVITEGQERAPCTALCDQAVTLLDGVTLAGAGYEVTCFHKSTTVVLSGDGESYVGTINLEAFALSA